MAWFGKIKVKKKVEYIQMTSIEIRESDACNHGPKTTYLSLTDKSTSMMKIITRDIDSEQVRSKNLNAAGTCSCHTIESICP